jgi:hypothetical protein
MDPHKLAADGLCRYFGDVNPLDHDGAWYEPTEWESNGYANCVRVTCMPEGPDTVWAHAVIIELLTINKPSAKGLADAMASCGVACGQPSSVFVEIEACLGYGHYDPNNSDYRNPQAHHLVIVDDDRDLTDGDRAAIARYCRIHNATESTEDAAWAILSDWVGRHSCNP